MIVNDCGSIIPASLQEIPRHALEQRFCQVALAADRIVRQRPSQSDHRRESPASHALRPKSYTGHAYAKCSSPNSFCAHPPETAGDLEAVERCEFQKRMRAPARSLQNQCTSLTQQCAVPEACHPNQHDSSRSAKTTHAKTVDIRNQLIGSELRSCNQSMSTLEFEIE